MLAPGRYLRWFGGTVLVLGVLVAGLNVAVDPYYLFGTPLLAGFNRVKPGAASRAALAKAVLLDRARPRTLLLGNSRMEVGFDPASAAWPASMRPVFNAGLSAYDLVISAAMLDHAVAQPGPLRHVLVGVDLFDFLGAQDVPRRTGPLDRGTDEARLWMGPGTAGRWWLKRGADAVAATLTMDALVDSVVTVFQQGRPGVATITPLGFNPAEDMAAYVAAEGSRALFEHKQAEYAARLAKARRPDFTDWRRSRSFLSLQAMIAAARTHDLELTLMIYPYHAWLLDTVRAAGLWDTSVAWRRALLRFLAEQDPEGRVRLVDFSGASAFTTEAVPAAGGGMRWYWEAGHFRAALGDRIVERLYDGKAGFGEPLRGPP